MSKVLISLSFFDIAAALESDGQAVSDYTEEQIHDALYEIGFARKHIDVEEVLHRPKLSPNNEPWFGKRYISFERQDREWLYSGKSTLENIISAQDDSIHRRDLMIMSMESNNTLHICEAMESAHKGEN